MLQGSGTGKYAANVGAQAYVGADGKLTTNTTSTGSATKDPLNALDEAIASIDKFRSSTGLSRTVWIPQSPT